MPGAQCGTRTQDPRTTPRRKGTFSEACSLRSCAVGSRRPVGSEEHLQLVRQGSHKDRLDSSGPLSFSALPSQDGIKKEDLTTLSLREEILSSP
ncbi:hypothetical protein VULLAG_LOCUS2401 [Vulpes lagopus]